MRTDLGYEPFISVHIASYNEKRVIERLLECCAAFEYRNYEVIVVDDSTDESTDILARWQARPGFRIIHRTSRDGFKGGALQEALRYTDPRTEYIVIFDADSMPFPDSLQRFLAYFYQRRNGDPLKKRDEVGAVQSYQWHVLNKSESWLTEAVRTEYAGSYMVERPYQEALGSLKMIAGTAYMIRADLLRQLGWGRSLTEDWELTLRLYCLGYKVVYTPYAETPAECVSTFSRFVRQRMRWAEGHTFNVRKHFASIVRSRYLNLTEKVEFLFYSTYYLQASLFLLGNLSWLLAELVFRVHVPQWTAMLGWSLLFTNLLALPLMNVSGLVLEAAPRKDFGGVLGALALSYMVVPFQAYAALKGLFEKEEGPWFRTPKTGRITDPTAHLKGLLRLRKWLKGPGRNGNGKGHHIEATSSQAPPRPARRLAWIVSAAMVLTLAALGVNAAHAPTVEAAGTTFYLHQIDTTPGTGTNAISFVRSASATETAAASTITVNISSTSGDLLVAIVGLANTTASLSSVTDSGNNYYPPSYGCTAGASGFGANYIKWAPNATAVTSVTFNFSASVLATAQVMEFSGVNTVIAQDYTGNGAQGSSTSPASTTIGTTNTNGLVVGAIQSPAAVTFSTGPTFSVGTTNNLAKVESVGGGSTDDLISGYSLPGVTTVTENYSGTYGSAAGWAACTASFRGMANMDTTAPTSAGADVCFMDLHVNCTWATQSTVSTQTIGAGTYTFQYWTNSPNGQQNVTATLTFGYSPDVGCSALTAITSWSATLIKAAAGATVTNTTSSSTTIPDNSYLCWKVTITAAGTNELWLQYDATTKSTNLNTPTITVPELGLALLGLALVAPLVGRRRLRDWLPTLNRPATRP
ncbi:MAG: glycosyltransferase family 2 protein [Chloroflexi bacterium]|nr:MAG: glycosyltransferase family 2 protein [Chloroflexota bacterium]